MPVVAPTTHQVEMALRRAPVSTGGFKDPWLHCRLDPFTSPGSTGKPDGRADRFIVVDHVVQDVISTDATCTGFTIITLPGFLPFTAVLTAQNSGAGRVTVNGLALSASGSLSSALAPIGVVTEWASSPAAQQQWTPSNVAKNDPYDSMSARVISVKRRLRYTGTLTQNSGWVSVTPNKVATAKQFALVNTTTVPAPAGGLAVQTFDRTLAATGALPVGTTVLLADFSATSTSNSSIAYTKDTVNYRVETGVEIVSKQMGEIHQFFPMPDAAMALVCNVSGIQGAAGVTYSPWNVDMNAAGAFPMGVWLNDDTWVGELINVNGLTQATSFVLETAYCVEYIPSSTSLMAPMTRRAQPARLGAITAAQNAVNRLPVAIPGNAM